MTSRRPCWCTEQKRKKLFWEFDSIIMQKLSDILPLFCFVHQHGRLIMWVKNKNSWLHIVISIAKFQDLRGSKTKKLDIKNLVLKAIDTSHHCRTGKLGWMVESDGAMHWQESERWSSVDIPVHLFLQYSLVWGGFVQWPRPSQGGPQWSTNCRPVREFHRFLLRTSSR